MKSLIRFFTDDSAATAVEYAVMLSLILMAVFATVAALGGNLSTSTRASRLRSRPTAADR